MPAPRGTSIVPSERKSVGGSHGEYQGSSNLPHVAGYQPGSDETAGSSHDSIEDRRRLIPRAVRCEGLLEMEDGSQYSTGKMGDEDLVDSDEGPSLQKNAAWWKETRSMARKRAGKPESESKPAKRKAAVPGGARSNHGPRNRVRLNKFGLLEFLEKKGKAWKPAIYHCMNRDKLINKAEPSETDVYEYPRARGKHELDITAFLPSQKDWDLERDNGWKAIGLEALYKFELDYKTPTYKVPWMYHEGCVVLDLESNPVKDFANIPLTCSSKIEGVEMEAMRRGDPRIAMKDFVARLPEQRKGEKPITANALNMRITRFRSENRVTALNERWGTNNGKHSLLDRMTQTARDANSTRELKKLSEDEEKKAQEPDARKHAANARGRPRGQKGQNHEENDISGPANAYEEGATKPACRESGTNKTPHVASSLDRPKKRQKICDMIPSAAQETYPGTLYGDESLDRLQRSNLANHYDGPSRYSSNFHDILSTVITTAASSEKAQPFPIRDGQISSEGFETFTEPSRFLAREFPNYQQMIPTVQQHSKNWIADVASPLENPYHDSQGQMLPSGDVAEDFFGTKQRISNTFANGTDPAEIPLPMQAEYQNNAPRIDQDFGMQWNWSENPFSVPDLMTSQEPWRNDFMNGARSTSGDDAFLDALFGEHEGANTQELLSYDPTMAAGHENE